MTEVAYLQRLYGVKITKNEAIEILTLGRLLSDDFWLLG
jgi:hypothetical protein